jgi:hypothetical protein
VVRPGPLRPRLRFGHVTALLGLAVPAGAGAVVHFTGGIDPNLTGASRSRSRALARSGCRLGRRGDRAGRRRTPRLHAAMATARAGALRPGVGSAVLARSGDGLCTLCVVTRAPSRDRAVFAPDPRLCTAPRWLRAAAELAVVAAEISGLLTLSQLRDPLGGHSSSPREVPVLQLRLAAKG